MSKLQIQMQKNEVQTFYGTNKATAIGVLHKNTQFRPQEYARVSIDIRNGEINSRSHRLSNNRIKREQCADAHLSWPCEVSILVGCHGSTDEYAGAQKQGSKVSRAHLPKDQEKSIVLPTTLIWCPNSLFSYT